MIKVLIVLDGDYRFATDGPQADFTYKVLFETLDSEFDVTKAHRQNDSDADLVNFNFETSVDLLDFDVLWLLGHDGRNEFESGDDSGLGLGADEGQLAAIARFMDAGGGVFATGDHDSIGSEMCGRIPRVRAMRSWYGEGDDSSPMPAGFPRNFPSLHVDRADTTQRNPAGNYGGDASLVWFENQSDSVPQPLTPTPASPAHPILRRNGADIQVYPDHMHEGRVHGPVAGYDYDLSLSFDGTPFEEFPTIVGPKEKPAVIARGQSLAVHQKLAANGGDFDPVDAQARAINLLSVYEGRNAGVGRIVAGSTFHHYIDINLTGDSDIVSATQKGRTGPDAEKGHGFAHPTPAAMETFAAIKAVFVNITRWLARPRPVIDLILERSTFSQDEAAATADFDNVILVTVDGLKPSQFPGGGIDTLDMAGFQPAWAPTLTPLDPTGLAITPLSVASDDPGLHARLQRFTFRYRVHLEDSAFSQPVRSVRVDASLTSPAVAAPLVDQAWIQLVEAANPFMLDLAQGNQTVWLSSDLRVFPVVADGSPLADNADRAGALDFLRDLVDNMTIAQFEALPMGQGDSTLSAFPTATGSGKRVYNFAVARVRLTQAAAAANDVRVFFRIVPSPTTAALTYREVAGVPVGSYMKTPGASPIALPGTDSGASEWVSFPVFSNSRTSPPNSQTDDDNKKTIPATAAETSTFFGALIDNNLTDTYLPPVPGSPAAPISLKDLMMGEHQCIVAQVEYAPAPIPDNAKPSTSDKLSQRNLALSAIPNPGVDGSRTALHTFEIEATPNPIADDFPPDELLLEWSGRTEQPDGTEVRIWIPSWNAHEVVELADRLYARHELRALDSTTVALPGGGLRYVPVPRGFARATGIVMADFPLGIRKGERFDLDVRQVSNRGRQANVPPPRVTKIARAQAAALLAGQATPTAAATVATPVPRGVFDLGDNRTLITDLSVLDGSGDHALVLEHPEPALIAAAVADSGRWRETIGAFRLGVPVSVKADLLAHHIRLLSVLRWRAQWLRPNGRWYVTFRRYVELIADKVQALGGDPWSVPATPDGEVKLPGVDPVIGPDPEPGPDSGDFWHRYCPTWLALLILLLLVVLLILLLVR